VVVSTQSSAYLQKSNELRLSENYPHRFKNNEKLPFNCGAGKQEFPILLNGQTYTGGAVGTEPDRVVFEYKETKTDAIVSFCGIMRHGPNGDFLKC
jgi:hypothetical protein